MKLASLCCTLAVLLGLFPIGVRAEEDPLEERIEHLEEHLFVVDAQLGKLELIRKSLEQMREDDLVRLRKLMWPGNKAPRNGSNAVQENSGSENKATAEEPPAEESPLAPVSVLDDDATPAERTSALEKLTAQITRRFEMIDTIAEQLHLFRNEDLAGLSRDVRGLQETTKKVGPGGKSIVVPPSGKSPQGELIFNNTTRTPFRIGVNGRERQVSPGRTVFRVPLGPVQTQLIDFEAPRTWPRSQWQQVDGKYRLQLDLKN
jgi:hypothetical protein